MKQLLLILLMTIGTFQTYSKGTITPPMDGVEARIAYLSDKMDINNQAIRLAIIGYEKLKMLGKLTNSKYLTIADFSKPSSMERLYVIDMELQKVVLKTLVAHGRNSGTLFAKQFSNKSASYQSSLGFYITGKPYNGKHGTSLSLNGIEEGINDKANQRAIVMHGADYVSQDFIQRQGYIGRSQGCPAVPNNQIKGIIKAIEGASCLFVYAPNSQYLTHSTFIR
jgi:hypothetical protein